MAYDYKVLSNPIISVAPVSVSATYTKPSSAAKAYVHTILFHNVTASAAIASVYYTPNGQAASDTTNRIFKKSLNPDDTFLLEFQGMHGLQLPNTGDAIQIKSSIASAITFTVQGAEE